MLPPRENETSRRGWSTAAGIIGEALHEAIRRGHGEIASDLVENGASIEAKDVDGKTTLYVAAISTVVKGQ